MADSPFEQVVELAKQLTPEEQQAPVRKQRPSEVLKVFHVGEWPEGLTLRREDEYGDDGR